MENFLGAIKEGANAYVKGKKKRKVVEEVFDPIE